MKEEGWSLPLIPILLVAVLASMYFFGWKLLLIPLVALVVIPLGTFLYDRFPRRAPEQAHFWFHSDQDLSRLWELLMRTEHHSTDAEDVWEWWGHQVQEGECRYHLSISRKHGDSSYPVHIRVTYKSKEFSIKMREDLGHRFAKALHMDVKAGSAEYLDGNEYAFTEEETFKYETH